MMRVFVTGGNGSVGKAAVARLVKNGFSVKVIGRSAGKEISGAAYEQCDINDYAALRRSLRGYEAIVHLAAIASPNKAGSHEVFYDNVQGTFNVFKAAEEEGIGRVVQASSINALGMFYGRKPAPFHYLPVDEAHPCLASDAYSFSKQMVEDIGDYYWHRSGISSVAYRLPWVAPADYHAELPKRQAKIQAFVERLQGLSPEERNLWFQMAWQQYNDLRAQGALEDDGVKQRLKAEFPERFGEDYEMMGNRVNLWTMLDERDSAQAIELALVKPYQGSHTLFVNDDHNWSGVPSRTLVELFYPDVSDFKTPLEGTATLVSIDRVRALLGFQVEHSFGG